jgi:hypothetical protein
VMLARGFRLPPSAFRPPQVGVAGNSTVIWELGIG